MRKTLGTTLVSLALASSVVVPAYAAEAAPSDACPVQSYVDAGPLEQVKALEGQNAGLQAQLHNANWKLRQRWHRVEHQAREIRHLRAELRKARAEH